MGKTTATPASLSASPPPSQILRSFGRPVSLAATCRYSPATLRARAVVRAELQEITAPIVAGRVLPLVNRMYPGCKGECTVCHSLVRRYLGDERRMHGLHFDIQVRVLDLGLNLTEFSLL